MKSDDEKQPDQHRIDVEIIGQARAYTSDDPVLCVSLKFLDVFHFLCKCFLVDKDFYTKIMPLFRSGIMNFLSKSFDYFLTTNFSVFRVCPFTTRLQK